MNEYSNLSNPTGTVSTPPEASYATPYGAAHEPFLTPLDLAGVRRWCAWRKELDESGRATKRPYRSQRYWGSSTDQGTWLDYEQAQAVASRLPKPLDQGGVGLYLGALDGLHVAGVDLDSCLVDGKPLPWAQAILDRFNTYAEVSPSGGGLKAYFTLDPADLPALQAELRRDGTSENGRKWSTETGGGHPPGIELYLSGRFFAFTGQRYGDVDYMRCLDAEDLTWLLTEGVPALLAAYEKPSDTTPRASSGDNSRSARAMGLAGKIKRAGGTYEAFSAALEQDPDLAAWKAEKGLPNNEREMRRAWEKAWDKLPDDGVGLITEDSVADAFAAHAVHDRRYCHGSGTWFQWADSHWRKDTTHAAFTHARRLTKHLAADAEAKVQVGAGRAAFCKGVEIFAQRDERLAVTIDAWDRHTYLLATPGGTVDLKTGLLRPAAQEDMLTRVAAVAPAMPGTACPTWQAFLQDATKGDQALIDFLQCWAGYCLTGDTREHALLFCYGPGGNGKSVFINTLTGIMGDYATTAAMDTFTASQGDKHPTDLAMLRGARMVTASETEEGKAWAESRIKQMTGGDPITARFMRQDFFTFTPSFKLTVVGNHKPVLKNVDDAARRRFCIVPFTHKPTNPDRGLEAKLKAEWPAILRWMIDGCVAWQRQGLIRPPVVLEATAEYFEAQDMLGQWLAERCILAPHLQLSPAALLKDFNAWADENSAQRCDAPRFRGWIERQPGIRYKMVKGVRTVSGLGLKPTQLGGEGGGGWR